MTSTEPVPLVGTGSPFSRPIFLPSPSYDADGVDQLLRARSVELTYSMALHQHRFAAWAAARAASVVGRRFRVEVCAAWLEQSGFGASFGHGDLPAPTEVNQTHRVWRREIIGVARRNADFVLTHGQAAKIINCYLKARFVTAQYEADPKVSALHPPIDRLLLDGVLGADVRDQGAESKIIRSLRSVGWSKWESGQYECVITILSKVVGDQPFWTIEDHWPGFQKRPR